MKIFWLVLPLLSPPLKKRGKCYPWTINRCGLLSSECLTVMYLNDNNNLKHFICWRSRSPVKHVSCFTSTHFSEVIRLCSIHHLRPTFLSHNHCVEVNRTFFLLAVKRNIHASFVFCEYLWKKNLFFLAFPSLAYFLFCAFFPTFYHLAASSPSLRLVKKKTWTEYFSDNTSVG